MIKNTIIIILILLLIITLYSYFCLSNKMLNYEKERMEYIVNKERELKVKDSVLKGCEGYQTELNNCKTTISSIKDAIAENISKLNRNLNNVQDASIGILQNKVVESLDSNNKSTNSDNQITDSSIKVIENKEIIVNDETGYYNSSNNLNKISSIETEQVNLVNTNQTNELNASSNILSTISSIISGIKTN